MTLKVGVIGVGHLMAHVVPGLMRAEEPPEILLSARNADRVEKLSDKFGLSSTHDNAEIVKTCDVVIIAVRPFDVEETIAGLPWRKDQIALSFAGTVAHETIEKHVNRATAVVAMPVISAEFGESPTSMYPDNATVRKLLEPCGPVFAFDSEETFNVVRGSGAYFGWVQGLIMEMTDWMVDRGVPADQARAVVANMTRAGATSAGERSDVPLSELVNDLCLPGSLTGQGLEILRNADAFTPWKDAADSIYNRRGDNS